MMRMPDFLQPQPARYSMVLAINAEGSIVHNLQDPNGGVPANTAALPSGGNLYLGSLKMPSVARIKWPLVISM